MKKRILMILAFAMTFTLGFAFNSIITKGSNRQQSIKKITGIGGIFFKCKDPDKMREWYQKHLGLNTNKYGAVFEWHQGGRQYQKRIYTMEPFPMRKQKYFEPSAKDFMIELQSRKHGSSCCGIEKKISVTIVDSIETVEYGKFVHILDIEGNKIELWEPNDVEFEKLGKQIGAKTTK